MHREHVSQLCSFHDRSIRLQDHICPRIQAITKELLISTKTYPLCLLLSIIVYMIVDVFITFLRSLYHIGCQNTSFIFHQLPSAYNLPIILFLQQQHTEPILISGFLLSSSEVRYRYHPEIPHHLFREPEVFR